MSAPVKLVGMLHAPPLPGSPRASWPIARIEAHVVAEARALAASGFDAAILENFGDVPFDRDSVGPVTVAAMTRLATAVRGSVPSLVLGINVLRNDSASALAIAFTTDAAFIRVNVHVGATATDQGVIEGRAASTTRLRARHAAPVSIWADVHVKHGRSLSHLTVESEAEDAVERGLADALIVSGRGTGQKTLLDDVRGVAALGLGVPVYVGSGVDEKSVGEMLSVADGVIVDSALKHGGRASSSLDSERVKRFAEAARA